MNTSSIAENDILDIIFKNKNKAYGAYQLRKSYNGRLLKSIGVTFGSAIILSAFTFLPKKTVLPKEEIIIVSCPMGSIEPPAKKEEPKIKKELPKPSAQVRTQLWAKPKIVDIKTPTDDLPTNLDSVVISNNTNAVDSGTHIVSIPIDNRTTKSSKPEGLNDMTDITIPRDFAEINPSYPGGINALKKFLERNLINPRDLEEGEIITVKIKFVVGFDGKLQSFEAIEDGGDIFNNEVIRVLKKMPEWIPGKTKGKNVSVYYTIPVKFVTAE